MSKWIVVTGSKHLGPFESAGAAGEFLTIAGPSFPVPHSIVQLYDGIAFQKEVERSQNIFEEQRRHKAWLERAKGELK